MAKVITENTIIYDEASFQIILNFTDKSTRELYKIYTSYSEADAQFTRCISDVEKFLEKITSYKGNIRDITLIASFSRMSTTQRELILKHFTIKSFENTDLDILDKS